MSELGLLAEIALVDDVLRVIFRMLVNQNLNEVASFCRVNKRWNGIGSESEVWKEYALRKWPLLATSKRIKNWKLLAKRRTEKSGSNKIIENCPEADVLYKEYDLNRKSKCPQQWNQLETTQSSQRRHCASCDKNVYLCESIEELSYRVRLGDCVGFKPSTVAKRFGDYFARIPVVGNSESGKSTWLSFFKHTKEADDSIYVEPPPWKLNTDAMVFYKHPKGLKYEFYFEEQPLLEEPGSITEVTEMFVVFMCKPGENIPEICSRIRNSKRFLQMFAVTNTPNPVKQYGMHYIEADCSTNQGATEVLKKLADAYYTCFHEENEDDLDITQFIWGG